ncbi:MAG: hypothetical protein L3K13_08035 [Thermoplasmata archaeon]|nr:hypothetical protein [Thermoplasmata archaeon]
MGSAAPAPRMAAAFAPGHVTGLFVPALEAKDPRGRGSLGAGIVLPLGVRASARWKPGGSSRLRIVSDLGGPLPISREVARRLLGRRHGSLEVFLSHELPVGCGFGMSAAGALATGLATASVLGEARSSATEIAHLADLFGGGGWGGVAAILGGGMEFRQTPGVPPWGEVLHRPVDVPIWIATTGPPLPSPPLLRSEVFRRRVAKAGVPGLSSLGAEFSLPSLMSESERFSDRLALAPPKLRRTLELLRGAGARAAQAMLGRSLFAIAPDQEVRRRIVEIFESVDAAALELRPPRVGAGLRRVRTA